MNKCKDKENADTNEWKKMSQRTNKSTLTKLKELKEITNERTSWMSECNKWKQVKMTEANNKCINNYKRTKNGRKNE